MKIKQELINKTRIKHPKRVIFLTLGALLVVALGIYAFLSYQAWNAVQQRSEDAASSLKKAIEGSLGAESPTEAPAAQIETIIAHFNKTYGDNPCDISSLYGWQTILPAVSEIKTTCAARSESSLGVIEALKTFEQYLKDQKAAATTLAATFEATKDPSDYAAAAKTWQESTSTLATTETFKPVADKVKEVTASVSAAYAALATASTAEDKAAFDTAISALKTAYETIPTINNAASDTQNTLMVAVINAYEKL